MSEPLGANSIISRFRIVSRIGAGGMGEVYLAQDTKLERKVALKILPADLASNKDRMVRFIREAKSAAALTGNDTHLDILRSDPRFVELIRRVGLPQ